MRVLLAQLNPTIGSVDTNVQAMLAVIKQAQTEGAQLVVFPELAVPGYMPKDMLEDPWFVDQCLNVNQNLLEASTETCMVIWGNIAPNPTNTGKPLYNAAYVALNGELIAMAKKAHLPTYDVFNETRYFEPSPHEEAITMVGFGGKRFAVTVCEDLWSHPCLDLEGKAVIAPVTYATQPLKGLQETSVDILVNVAASPYTQGKPLARKTALSHIAKEANTTILYTNQVGGNDDVVWDGTSAIFKKDGTCWLAPSFQESSKVVDVENLSVEASPPLLEEEEELASALILGIQDYMHKTGFQNVFIGLSGGLDSALTAVLAAKALGSSHVTGVAMPGPYSSPESAEDARLLAKNLGIHYQEQPIDQAFEAFITQLSEGERFQDLAEQNLQARLRGTMLMTLANRHNALVLATGNKSEAAMGYSTLYGDTCGALAPIGDVYKTQAYQLCQWFNQQASTDLIPTRILEKPPSAELAPNQKDTDSLPPYPVLDGILKAFVEDHLSIEAIARLGYDTETVSEVVRRVLRQEFKRNQCPSCIKVSSKAFGNGRVYPIVQQAAVPAMSLL